MFLILVSIALCSYLLGSVSSAVIVTKYFIKQDIRILGSGNPGATNVLRVAGKRAAVLVFLFDTLKGTIPVYIGFILNLEPFALSLIAISACLGHIYPVFFQFKGGKGVATAFGALMPLDWMVILCILSTWLLTFIAFRISSVAAIISFLLAPVYTYMYKEEYTGAVVMLCVIILIKHKGNIIRLVNRSENSFTSKKS